MAEDAGSIDLGDSSTGSDGGLDAGGLVDAGHDAGSTTDLGPPCAPPTVADLVLTEVLYDPANSFTGARDQTDGDANCDCDFAGGTTCSVPNSTGNNEFIEFVNVGSNAVDLQGVVVTVGGSPVHTFEAGACLNPGQAALLFRAAPDTVACPALGAALTVVTSFVLTNAGSSVALSHPTLAPAGFNLGSITWLESSAASDVSLIRDPELTGVLVVAFDTVSGGTARRQSPGTCTDGASFSTACL